jgi:hypothetical protein
VKNPKGAPRMPPFVARPVAHSPFLIRHLALAVHCSPILGPYALPRTGRLSCS